jgi:predicted dehydrogenase/threonine dehydrogenase-like Zn-dependent dehydrogenase
LGECPANVSLLKQVLQNLSTGETTLVEVPAPMARAGCLLIRTRASLISLGTERMLLEFGRASLWDKARQQPEKVQQVLHKIRTEGLLPTVEAVRAKLDQPLALGYCNAGEVLAVGAGVTGFEVGTAVLSNGPHAEIVCVPKNLCAKIPVGMLAESAPFAVVGSIALQGVRLAEPTLGECFVVTGLGLVGLLAGQILQAAGARVLGLDFDAAKCALGRELGFAVQPLAADTDPVALALAFSGGRGVDGVLLTAATKSSGPVNQAAAMCRQRGRVIQVGTTGLELVREEFYRKEIRFQVSCSYGPGRYDENYEVGGQDYPLGFVRWTEQRNFEAMLRLIERGAVKTGPLISHRFSLGEAAKAYDVVHAGGGLGIVLTYGGLAHDLAPTHVVALSKPAPAKHPQVVVGALGSGVFGSRVLLPALKRGGARLKTLVSNAGVSGTHNGRKAGFEFSATDPVSVLGDPEINTVFVLTRHDSHAKYALAALKAGKRVFVEKPLCLNRIELEEIKAVYAAATAPYLLVGFNRRFAPHSVRLKQSLSALTEPKTMVMIVNAGILSPDHWNHDPAVGGGRLLSEAVHFIDYLRFLVGHPIVDVKATCLGPTTALQVRDDKLTITLTFADGSIGTVHYFGNGAPDFPKERLEVFCAGRVVQLDNFKTMCAYNWPGFRRLSLFSMDKGHQAEIDSVIADGVAGEPSQIPFLEICEVMEAAFDAQAQLR